MKYVLKSIWFCVAVSLLSPITTQAELTGEVIFLHPKSKLRELWISDVENIRRARRIFEYTRDIEELAVQNGGLISFLFPRLRKRFLPLTLTSSIEMNSH